MSETTDAFPKFVSEESRREAVRDGVPPIELVDGEKLLDRFEQLELGLEPHTTYAVVEAFFDELRWRHHAGGCMAVTNRGWIRSGR